MVPNISTIGSVADSGFNPKWISGLQLWFDAADSNTLYSGSTGGTLAVSSGSVGRWEDKSDNRWHATQSIEADCPRRITASYNGLDTIRFDGTNDTLLISGALGIMTNVSESTFFVVASSRRGGGARCFFFINNGVTLGTSRIRFMKNGLNNVTTEGRRLDGDAFYTFNYFPGGVVSSSLLTCYCSGIKFNTSSSYYYVNGINQVLSGSMPSSWSGSTSNATSLAVAIGSTATANYLNGDISELIYYNRYINDVERRSIERYLTRKWNIRSYDQKTSSSADIFSNLELYLDANNIVSNPGSGSTWYDISGKGRNATLFNGAAFATSQSIRYVDFDGTNDYVNCGKILNYTSESFSISCWARVTTGSPGEKNTILFSNSPTATYGYTCYLSSDGTTLQNFLVFFSYQAATNQAVTSQGGGNALGLRWVFYTITRSDSEVKMYLNGVFASSNPNAITNPASAAVNDLAVGAFYNTGTTTTFQNSIQRIGAVISHSKKLSDQEVLELYNFTKTRYNIVD